MERLKLKQRAVVQAYADSGMNVCAAARALGLSGDTVRYHLAAIKKKTGLDPRNFWDLARLLGLRQKGE